MSEEQRHEDDAAEILGRLAEGRRSGAVPPDEDWLREHPEDAEALRDGFDVVRRLDAVLAADRADSEPPPESVLNRLDADGRLAPRPALLQDVESPPVVLPLSGSKGRYQIMGEIARGGVGVVLKGHDVDLGRDVAVKVLRVDREGDPDVFRRFVEEAQIGGQLQHPGIVPVYELGVGHDQRPFFAMKLIKGRTLASLLQERGDPLVDRRRFVSIFESACQTVAYAHARGVIHRDLKPANVMVGAFGEVLIVDWGMGKVLRRGGVDDERTARSAPPDLSVIATVRSKGTGSESMVGSVMGTPAYMCPEQARGAVEELNERADVFSLGAILCELLTGSPPYVGTSHEVYQQAAAAALDGARARLLACGGDAELVALARTCLEPDPSSRPKDAGAVAAAVGDYLASLDEKRRAAETEAARATVRADEERKRRRLALALAAAVVAIVTLGGGGLLWFDTQRRGRAEAVAGEVAQALDETTVLRGKAAAASTDPSLWAAALSGAKRAAAIARSADADDATRDRATLTLVGVETEVHAAEALAQEIEADNRFVERIDKLRLANLDKDSLVKGAAAASAVAYAGAIKELLGNNIDTFGIDESAHRISASRIRDRIVDALDSWAEERHRAGAAPGLLPELIARVDPQAWRVKLRRATGNLEALRATAADARREPRSARDIVRLVSALAEAGDIGLSLDMALEAWRLYPDDVWVCSQCGSLSSMSVPPRSKEAIRFYTAALALRPRSASIHCNLGREFSRTGDHGSAIAELREAIRLDPASASFQTHLGEILLRSGDVGGARTALRDAIRLGPTNAEEHANIGTALLESGDIDGAIAELHEAIRLNPAIVAAQCNLGVAFRRKGDIEGAIKQLRASIQLEPTDAESHGFLGEALVALGDLKGGVSEYREAVRLDPKLMRVHSNLGVALLAMGNVEDAIAAYREAIRVAPDYAIGHLNLGLALAGRGQFDAAIAAYREAIRLDPMNPISHSNLGLSFVGTKNFVGAIAEFGEALRLDPQARSNHRYNAACAAALAASHDAMLDTAARARWRRQAIEWLRADLDSWRTSTDAATARSVLEHWKTDGDLASLREEAALAKIPTDDREACIALWRDVDAVLAKKSGGK